MTPAGYAAAMFYGAAVLVMKFTCFLVLIAMANVVISLYYYRLVLKSANIDEPGRPMPAITASVGTRLVAVVLISLIAGLGFYPTALFDLVQAAVLLLP